MSLELPKGVDEEDRVVPSILTRSIACTTCFQVDELASSGMNRGEMHYARIGDEGDSEVRMIMRGDDWASWDFFLGLFVGQHQFLVEVYTTHLLILPHSS